MTTRWGTDTISTRIITGVAAYVRVSSASQDVATQSDAISKAAAARGDKIEAWYSETVTGSRLARPELGRMRQDVRAGMVRRLYVYRLDRLTRTGISDTLTLIEELRTHGCELVTLADGFDIGGPAWEVVAAVMAWAAKIERLAISERVQAARKRVEAEGGAWGRPRRMTSREIAKAVSLRGDGHSLRYIAQVIRVPRATVQRVLAQKPPLKVLAKTRG